MIRPLNLDIHEELVGHLDVVDAVSLLLTSRTLYYTDSLWQTLLNQARQRGPIACPENAALDTLSGQFLRRIGYRTASITKAWALPSATGHSTRAIKLSSYDRILAVIPGAEIVVTISVGEQPSTLRCIDVRKGREIGFMYFDNIVDIQVILGSLSFPPKNEKYGLYTMGLMLSSHLVALRVDFSDREEITFRQILKIPVQKPDPRMLLLPELVTPTCVEGTNLVTTTFSIFGASDRNYLLCCCIDIAAPPEVAEFHAIELDRQTVSGSVLPSSCFVSNGIVVVLLPSSEPSIVSFPLAWLKTKPGMPGSYKVITHPIQPKSSVTGHLVHEVMARKVAHDQMCLYSSAWASSNSCTQLHRTVINLLPVNVDVDLTTPSMDLGTVSSIDIRDKTLLTRDISFGHWGQYVVLLRRGRYNTSHYRFSVVLVSWPIGVGSPRFCQLELPGEVELDPEHFSRPGYALGRCMIDEHLGMLYVLVVDGTLHAISYTS